MGSPKGGNNNILNTTSATPKEISKLSSYALSLFENNTPDLHNESQVYDAIVQYFSTCERKGIRPGNMGLYAALGITRQDYNNMVTGKSRTKASPAAIDTMKRATRAISAFREGLAAEGKIHPTTYIFMSKNFDGLEDVTRLEVSADSEQTAKQTPDEIAKQIESDIPIDSVCHDID